MIPLPLLIINSLPLLLSFVNFLQRKVRLTMRLNEIVELSLKKLKFDYFS